MTAHRMGTLHRRQEDAVVEEAFLGLPAEGIWAAIGLIAAVIAPLVFGWGGGALPAVLFLVLCPFIVAGVLIADVAAAEKADTGAMPARLSRPISTKRRS